MSKNTNLSELPNVVGIVKGSTSGFSTAIGNVDFQEPITLTTNGTSGVSTFNGTTLNIPNYGDSNGTNGTSGTSGTSGYSGDKYLGTSDSDLTIVSSGIISFQVDTGLAYTPQQNAILTHDYNSYMQGTVTAYDSLTGDMSMDVLSADSVGTTEISWTINLFGAAGGDGSSGTSGTTGTSGTSGISPLLSLTTTGSSGASTYDSGTGVLNVPTYTLAGLGGIGGSGTSGRVWS